MQTKPDAFANSVDPDEMARNEPSNQDLHSLSACFDFWLASLFAIMEKSFHKLRVERVNQIIIKASLSAGRIVSHWPYVLVVLSSCILCKNRTPLKAGRGDRFGGYSDQGPVVRN